MGSLFHDHEDSIEADWQGQVRPRDFLDERSQKRELLADLRAGWDEGRSRRLEELLDRWPGGAGAGTGAGTGAQDDTEAASLLAEDFFERRRRGQDDLSVADYQKRFPAQASTLAALISQQTFFRSVGAESEGRRQLLRLPDVGDEIFGFRLRHPLGRGAFARVFLAEQADLAGRPVVLKISAIEGTEPQTLAQLQHTNIVPIYSVHEDARAGVRAVCMPYFGGASLSAVIRRLWATRESPALGHQFVAALAAERSPTLQDLAGPAGNLASGTPPMGAEPQSPLGLLERMSFCQAAAWVVARLADGLSHAHRRGILHRDVKPSNVLISIEGEPLLLDFNLAQDAGTDPAHATLGGTVAYMAPEHLRAIAGRNLALAAAVDGRSDIYSLGMVLAEFLTGHNPFDQSASYSVAPLQVEAMAIERSRCTPSLRAERPEIPWGLESIARKCLSPEPSARYQTADQLAEDLRRFLDDRPLKYAPELSTRERVAKYLRRHPRLASSGSVAAVALALFLAGGVALAGVRAHLDATRARLGEARARERLKAHDVGATRALCLVNTAIDLQDNLRRGAAVCEETLRLYDLDGGRPLDAHPDWAGLTGPQRAKLAEDRRELLLLLAGARVRLASGDRSAVQAALDLLDRAETVKGLPPSRALRMERARYLDLLGESDRARIVRAEAERTPAHTAADHYLLATAYAREGGRAGYLRAIAELDRALAINPRHYWSAVQRGICRLELGDLVLAAGDFGLCTGLWPEFAWGHFNRGCVLDRDGRKSEAIEDFTAALRCDSGFVPAYVNRGLARLERNRPGEALGDFDRALTLGARTAPLHAGRGMALEALGRHAEADAAFDRAFALAGSLPATALARMALTYGFAVSGRKPAEARRALDRALSAEPGNPQALYGLAMLDAQAGDLGNAVRNLGAALEVNPGFLAARRQRAVLLARQRRWGKAADEINRCLEREPDSSPTLYAAACVMALVFGGTGDDPSADQAIDLLKKARARGPLPSNPATDPDLDAIRGRPDFPALAAGTELTRAVTPGP